MLLPEYEKRGYLPADFKVFYLKDSHLREFQYHYHEFDKIIIFLNGKVQYMIEGKSYSLTPHDIILVNHNDIHKPAVDCSVPYERIILYIRPGFLQTYAAGRQNLAHCFELAKTKQMHVLQLSLHKDQELLQQMEKLRQGIAEKSFAQELYAKLLFLKFMVLLNRALLSNQSEESNASRYDPKTLALLAYINTNLFADLSVEALAQKFYISKYYMMRKFKSETGYTLHQYITHKRLLLSRDFIRENQPLTKICFDCGFKDYSTFSRAFKTLFHCTPSEYKKQLP